MINGLIELLEGEGGEYVLGALLSGRLKVSTVLDAGIELKTNDGSTRKTQPNP